MRKFLKILLLIITTPLMIVLGALFGLLIFPIDITLKLWKDAIYEEENT